MKIHSRHEGLTLGDFIMFIFDANDERQACMLVWIAFHARLVVSHHQAL